MGDLIAAPVTAVPAEIGAFTGERIPLQPVERVHITTLVVNMLDVLAADVGPAKRHPLGAWLRRPAAGDQADSFGCDALVQTLTCGQLWSSLKEWGRV